ncbi:hypothetical protein [Burkholderia sp. BCC0405]|uniref:hypothetical protein n=1 Tax=Burkholderia sp. BCC0405 TaxID=2676298 RepID=UPI00158B5C79|nr:hypothetical protein [Burkholderia sp. BCC0405]
MIRTNFRADLVAYIDARLAELEFDPSSAGDARENVPQYVMLLIRAMRRMPAVAPRRVVRAAEFSVPDVHEAGFRALASAVERGATLRPWLSVRVADLATHDRLLDDWGIHHFHLGVAPHPRRPGFVERTDEVVFAMVHPDAIYFLVATSHDHRRAPLVWTQPLLVDLVHRNWPALLDTPVSSSNAEGMSAEEHAKFRKCHVNVGVATSNGATYYPPGGGLMSNGDSARDYMYQMRVLRQVEHLEALVKHYEAQIRAKLAVPDGAELELKAQFQIEYPAGQFVQVYDPVRDVALVF